MDIKDEQVDSKTKQFRWSPAMERFLIDFLVEEVKGSRKVDKNFKKSSFVQAAKEVSKNFDVLCTADNVKNRMKTIRTKFGEVKKIWKNGIGISWNDSVKMFTCSDEVYKAYTEAHPTVVDYLNKSIKLYDELLMICGDDQATDSFAKSNTDDNQELDEVENVNKNSRSGVEDITSPNTTHVQKVENKSAEPRPHGKRQKLAEEFSEQLGKVAHGINEVAVALKVNISQEYAHCLFKEVMKMKDFSELELEAAFNYLNANEVIARSFLAKTDDGKKRWLTKYVHGISITAISFHK